MISLEDDHGLRRGSLIHAAIRLELLMLGIQHQVNNLVNKNKRYSIFSFAIVIASLVPLAFKDDALWLNIVEYCTVVVFIFEYLARWIAAPINIKRGLLSYFIYPFTPMAIIDLLTILPTFILINQGFKALRAVRLVLILRLFRFVRDSRSVRIIMDVIKRERGVLGVVCIMAVAYIFMTALIAFNVEPDTFPNYFEALYWACISLTTVGYGDIYPTTAVGQTISMVSALVGIAVVALPTGIITGGYIESMRKC